MIDSIMRRECATIATINLAEPKNPGTVPMRNSMQLACARIATSITTIERKGRVVQSKMKLNPKLKMRRSLTSRDFPSFLKKTVNSMSFLRKKSQK